LRGSKKKIRGNSFIPPLNFLKKDVQYRCIMKSENKFVKNLTGLQIIGKIYTKEKRLLTNLNRAKKCVSKFVKQNNLEELGSSCYKFKSGGRGFSIVVNLVESHCALHTWPEYNCLTLDVYVCNFLKDNSRNCQRVFKEIAEYFKPFKIEKKIVRR